MKKLHSPLFAIFLLPLAAVAVEPSSVLRISTPLILSAAGGLKFGEGAGYHPLLEGELGVGGGKAAVGLHSSGDTVDLAIKAAFLRTWIEPVGVDEDISFMGFEGELGINRLVLTVGGYRRVSSGDDDWLGSAGIGFKF